MDLLQINTVRLAIDHDGNFWAYLNDRADGNTTNYRLKKFNSSLVPIDSVKLPPMSEWGFDDLAFDPLWQHLG